MKIIAIVLILLLIGMFTLTVSIRNCVVLTRGYFAGRTVCYFSSVNIQPGTTTAIDVNIET